MSKNIIQKTLIVLILFMMILTVVLFYQSISQHVDSLILNERVQFLKNMMVRSILIAGMFVGINIWYMIDSRKAYLEFMDYKYDGYKLEELFNYLTSENHIFTYSSYIVNGSIAIRHNIRYGHRDNQEKVKLKFMITTDMSGDRIYKLVSVTKNSKCLNNKEIEKLFKYMRTGEGYESNKNKMIHTYPLER